MNIMVVGDSSYYMSELIHILDSSGYVSHHFIPGDDNMFSEISPLPDFLIYQFDGTEESEKFLTGELTRNKKIISIPVIIYLCGIPEPPQMFIEESLDFPVISYPLEKLALKNTLKNASIVQKLKGQVRSSEESFRIMFEKAADPILLIDPDNYEIIEFNEKAAEMFIFDKDDELKRTIFDIGIAGTTELIRKQIQGITSTGRLFNTKIETFDKRYVSIQTNRISIRGRIFIQGIFRDITEFIKTQRALKKSEERMSLAFLGAGLGWWDLDIPSARFHFDSGTAEMTGYTVEVINTDPDFWIDKIIHPMDVKKFRDVLKAFIKGYKQSVSIEYRIITRNGDMRWILCNGRTVEWTEKWLPRRVSGTHFDITEKKKTETLNEELYEKYRLLSENVTDVIWILNPKTFLLDYITPSCIKTVQYTPDELIQLPLNMWLTESSYQLAMGHLRMELDMDSDPETDPNRYKTLELEMIRKDGIIIITEATMNFIRDESGTPVSVLGVSRDITKRKNAEQQLHESLMEKEILLREIHHRVKNNLQVIIGMLNLQTSRITNPEIFDAFWEYENRIRAMALIHEELYHSEDLSHIDLLQSIKQIESGISWDNRNKSRNISFVYDGERVMVDINHAIPCAIVVNEIVTNSIKYAFPDRSRYCEIKVSLTRKDGKVRLVIADNGIGIPAEIDIRDPDYLGLRIIMMTVVNQLKGTVEVNRNKGTEYIISFPSI